MRTDQDEIINLETGSRIFVVDSEIYFGFPGNEDSVLASCRTDEEVEERVNIILRGVHIGADFRKPRRETHGLQKDVKKNEPMHD